jgi:hypothetical protein
MNNKEFTSNYIKQKLLLTRNLLDQIHSKDLEIFFIDGTFDIVPKNTLYKQLVTCIDLNMKEKNYKLCFVDLMTDMRSYISYII